MTTDMSRLIIVLLVFCLMWLVFRWQCQPHRGPTRGTAPIHRRLTPRTPDDCPACRQQPLHHIVGGSTRPPPVPWRELKSRRGAPKRIATDGFACPNPACDYFRLTDAEVHALVGDGRHGTYERIQTFRCQACGVTFSARRDTPLYRLKTSPQRIGEVLTALSEGLDIAAAERVFGHRHATITTWLTRAGAHGATLHDRCFRNLSLLHLQLDELRTRLRSRAHVLWLWVAIDPITKIIPVVHLGSRTQASAHVVVHALQQRLALDCLPVFTSDGLNHYFYALTAHFGDWVGDIGRRARQWQVAPDLIYGQVKKIYRCRRLVRVSYQMRCGTQTDLTAVLQGLGLSGTLNTAFVERVNLTIRQSVAALVRRSWSTAQQVPQLQAHLEWWRAYYHFARPHASLRVPLGQPQEYGGRRRPQRYRHRTPAMAAGVTYRRWTVHELLAIPLPWEPITPA